MTNDTVAQDHGRLSLAIFIEVSSSLCMQSHIVTLLVIAMPAGERWVG
jgi:hypothetical protein